MIQYLVHIADKMVGVPFNMYVATMHYKAINDHRLSLAVSVLICMQHHSTCCTIPVCIFVHEPIMVLINLSALLL